MFIQLKFYKTHFNTQILNLQIEVLNSMGRTVEAAQLLDMEIEASGMDREVIMSLPPGTVCVVSSKTNTMSYILKHV